MQAQRPDRSDSSHEESLRPSHPRGQGIYTGTASVRGHYLEDAVAQRQIQRFAKWASSGRAPKHPVGRAPNCAMRLRGVLIC